MSGGDPLDAGTRAIIAGLFEGTPDDPAQAFERFRSLSLAFKESMAAALEPVVHAHLEQKDARTLRDYQRNATEINQLVGDLGLCIQRRGKPGLLVGERAYEQVSDAARYAVMVPDKRQVAQRTLCSVPAPHLHLMPADADTHAALEAMRRRLAPGRSR